MAGVTGRPRRLVLHAGLPKTGSTAVQRWADRNRDALLRQGVDYPPPLGAGLYPNHQFLVHMLSAGHADALPPVLAASRAPCLFLSTEGLSNHLYDYPPDALAAFRTATAGIRVSIFVVLREEPGWSRSLYKQAVLNPPVPRLHYATALDYESFRGVLRVRRLSDHAKLLDDLRVAYGAAEVVSAGFREDWIGALCDHLGVVPDTGFAAVEAENVSVPDAVIELVRQVNGLGLPDALREAVLALVQHSEKTGHAILAAHARAAVPATQTDAALAGVLARLAPATVAEREVLRRLRATLRARRGGLRQRLAALWERQAR